MNPRRNLGKSYAQSGPFAQPKGRRVSTDGSRRRCSATSPVVHNREKTTPSHQRREHALPRRKNIGRENQTKRVAGPRVPFTLQMDRAGNRLRKVTPLPRYQCWKVTLSTFLYFPERPPLCPPSRQQKSKRRKYKKSWRKKKEKGTVGNTKNVSALYGI